MASTSPSRRAARLTPSPSGSTPKGTSAGSTSARSRWGGKLHDVEAAVNYQTLRNLRRFSFAFLGGLAVASLAIGWVLSGRVLRPVRAISRTAEEIQATDLSQRIRLTGPRDELRVLAETVDSMLDRLDGAFRAQRQLVDDASHELRSPLAIIRANVDAVLASEESSEQE